MALSQWSRRAPTTRGDVTVLNLPDLKFNPVGSREVGEIGITGTAAAVANAIYNATGKRVRSGVGERICNINL